MAGSATGYRLYKVQRATKVQECAALDFPVAVAHLAKSLGDPPDFAA
jgi:hypothetical protein